MKWVVEMRDNVTAYDTFLEEHHQGPITKVLSTFIFETEGEALEFYRKMKRMLKFAGTDGMYYTYPVQKEDL